MISTTRPEATSIEHDAVFVRAESLTLAATADETLIPQYETAMKQARDLEGHRKHLRSYRMTQTPSQMTQVELILHHINEAGSITQREAYLDYGIQSFHRRLSDIRQMGITLLGVQKTHPITGQEYTRYYMSGAKQNNKKVAANV